MPDRPEGAADLGLADVHQGRRITAWPHASPLPRRASTERKQVDSLVTDGARNADRGNIELIITVRDEVRRLNGWSAGCPQVAATL
jgi:hypothetical protein